MGGGCYRSVSRELFYVGGYCENQCFSKYGYCEASSDVDPTKTHDTCELKPEYKERDVKPIGVVNAAVAEATEHGKEIFLYTPDMFSDFYFEECFTKLPNRNDRTHICINACVRTLIDKLGYDMLSLKDKGIREVWVGVESANPALRDKYDKPSFTNEELEKLTIAGRISGVDICWFLVDGCEDTDKTRLETYNLIKDVEPFRLHVGQLKSYQGANP